MTPPGVIQDGFLEEVKRLCKIIELNSPGGHRAMREAVKVQGKAGGKVQRTESLWPIRIGPDSGVQAYGLRTEGTLVIFRGGNRLELSKPMGSWGWNPGLSTQCPARPFQGAGGRCRRFFGYRQSPQTSASPPPGRGTLGSCSVL